MKNAEPMEQALKSTELVLASDEVGGLEMPSVADQRRRRLVRGAAAFAPVVLTLRSGALAAASCTGAKVLNLRLDKNGGDSQSPSRIDNGDYCFPNLNVCTTPGTTNKVETPLPGQPIPSYEIASGKKCPTYANKTVAILSSTSAGSFLPLPPR